MKNNKFDWYDYYKLANSYSNEEDIAKLRTGRGRYYYSTFLVPAFLLFYYHKCIIYY